MKAFISWTLYLVIYLIPNICITYPSEYYVKSGAGTSYLYRKFDDIKEDVFPRDIRINVSFSSMVGTLLYSIDKHMNQLIGTIRDVLPYTIEVKLNKQSFAVTLSSLCGCDRCRYEILDLRIQISTSINLQCNGGNIKSVPNEYKKDLDENYPILYNRTNITTQSTNEAHLWLVNTPNYQYLHPNHYQMYGCIFKVSYNTNPITFTNVSSNIGQECIKTCTNNICNGGQCYETYSITPICNCSMTFLNGQYCNDSIHPINLMSLSQHFVFDMLKISWKNSFNEILSLNNVDRRITLNIEKGKVFFQYRYGTKQSMFTRVALTDNYVPNRESICIVYFKNYLIDIWFINNGILNNWHMPIDGDLSRELFNSLTLRSGDGSMDLASKSINEYSWSKVDIPSYIDIKKDTILLIMRISTIKSNTTGPHQSNVITGWTVGIIICGICLVGIIVGVFFCRKRRRLHGRNRLYSPRVSLDSMACNFPSEANEDDMISQDTNMTNLLGDELKGVANEDEMKSQYTNMTPLLEDEFNDKEQLKEEIGLTIIVDNGSKEKWMDHINGKMKSNRLSVSQLERIYGRIKEAYARGHLSDIIVELIHARIFVIPSMIAKFDLSSSINIRSIQHLIESLDDKYEHPSSDYYKLLLESLTDFLEDLSQDYKKSKRVHELTDATLSYLAYFTIKYEYKYERDVSFLGSYNDGSARLWSAVILSRTTQNNEYLDTMKEYLDKESQKEVVSNDMIVVYVAALDSVINMGQEWTFSNMDYRIIVAIHKCGILTYENIKSTIGNIIKIFNNSYRSDIINTILEDNEINENNQKIAINCLTVSLQYRSVVDRDIKEIIVSLLEELNTRVEGNIVAIRTIEIILYHVLEYNVYRCKENKNRISSICKQYRSLEHTTDEIRLSSSVIISHIPIDGHGVSGMKDTMGDIVTFLSDIINRMSSQNSTIYLGFYILEIKDAMLKIKNQERNKLFDRF